jgi:Asp-tRNA(Asn)/Glu-tRNA(Gln) amidotransferase A subunit family amidase
MLIVSLDHDVVGVMGFTAYDVALMLGTIINQDWKHDQSEQIPGGLTSKRRLIRLFRLAVQASIPVPMSYTQFTQSSFSTFQDLNIGFPKGNFFDLPELLIPGSCVPQVRGSMLAAADRLRQLGANIVPADFLIRPGDAIRMTQAFLTKLRNEFREDFEASLPSLSNASVASLEELINFNDRHAVGDVRQRPADDYL